MARTLDAAAVLAAAALLVIAASGGVDLQLGRLALRLHDPLRPAALFAAAVALRVVLWRPRFLVLHAATLGVAALLVSMAGVYLQHHVRVAGGLDSYGYVSAAALITSGRLTQPQPLAAILPFEDAIAAAAPLGHVPAPEGMSSVPRFPLGLPLVMAAVSPLGPAMPYFVPLLLSFGTLVVVYRLGRASVPRHVSADPEYPIVTGLFAAAIVGIDPLFAASAIQPMSDVPATFWLVAACWGVLRPGDPRCSSARAVGAGLCAGMALLTRPALAPSVLVLLLTTLDQPRRVTMAMGVPLLVVGCLQAAINVIMYGSPTASGYGSASHMFDLSFARLVATSANFGGWLSYSHTPLFWVLWPGTMVVLRREMWAWKASAVAGAAAAPYLFYLVFDDWESSRFLLPGITIVLLLAACAAARMAPLGVKMLTPALLTAVALVLAASSHRFLEREGIFRLSSLEEKYSSVGEWFRTNTPDRAVVLSSLHSGSIRLYGNRLTVRFDQIPGDALGATVRRLRDAGYEPYLALDLPSEPPLFEERFGNALDSAPQIARVRVVNIHRFVSAE